MSTATVRTWNRGDPAPADVTRLRDARGDHWYLIEPGSQWFRCEETGSGMVHWPHLLISKGPLVDSTADEGPADPHRLRCGIAYVHLKEAGRFVTPSYIGPNHVGEPAIQYLKLDKYGEVPRSGRVRSGLRRPDRVAASFVVYRPCRWALECLAQATVTIAFDHLGQVDACDKHAADYRAWAATSWSRRDREPEPDCWCPDGMEGNWSGDVNYCPRCGTGRGRGTEFDTHRLAYDLPPLPTIPSEDRKDQTS